jgi:DNA-directed RNA polymerase specialized sigma24 family protein
MNPVESSPQDNSQDNSQDIALQKLAIAAQDCSLSSREQGAALSQLIRLITESNRLFPHHRSRFTSRYDEIFEEACQDLFVYLSKNIQRYDPQKATVITWVNNLMKRRFIWDASRKILGKLTVEPLDWSELDNQASYVSETDSLSSLLKECLLNDPDNLFEQECVKNCPEASFKAIAERYLAGVSWREMSTEFQIPVPTLSSFFQRNLKKFQPQIKEYIQQ